MSTAEQSNLGAAKDPAIVARVVTNIAQLEQTVTCRIG